MAGLSAAWKLSEWGFSVDVLEARDDVGGLAQTLSRDGFIFDYGPHRFHTDNPAILNEIRELVGPELEDRARKTTVYFLNKYFDYPLSAANLLTNLPKSLAVASVADFAATWLRNKIHPRPDDSFEAWVVNRFGRRLYDVYFGPYTAKVWGRDPKKLSSSWAAQRVAVVDLWDLLVRLLGLKREGHDFQHSPYLIDFYYPRSGAGRISELMAERIKANGGVIRLNAPVQSVEHTEGHVSSVTYRQDGAVGQVPCDYLVSSIAITDLVKLLSPKADPETLASANSLGYRALIFVFLALNKDRVTDDNWIYFPAPETIFNRISEMKNFTPDSAPPGKTSLTVEISCDVGDEVWNMPEAELYGRSVEGLVQAGLIKREEILFHFLDRTAHGYPTYDVNFEANLGRLAYHLAGYDNVVPCGRQGLFRYLNMDHCVEMGFCAAEEIANQELGAKVTRVGQEQVYFG